MESYDVIVVGLGPVGAALCCLLGRSNLKVLALEATDGLHKSPRAAAMDAEGKRFLVQKMGITKQFDRGSSRALGIDFVFGYGYTEPGDLEGDDVVHIKGARSTVGKPGNWLPEDTTINYNMSENDLHPRFNLFFQPSLEELLKGTMESTGNVTFRYNALVTNVESNQNMVQVTFVNPKGKWEDSPCGEKCWVDGGNRASATTISAKYVVGCDGVKSTIRRIVNPGSYESLDYDIPWLVIDILVHDDSLLGDKVPYTAQFINGATRQYILVTGTAVQRQNGEFGRHIRIDVKCRDGDSKEIMESREKVQELLSHWLAPAQYDIIRANYYHVHALIAPKWFNGDRIFLAGDSAHVMPHLLGQGLNQGLKDVSSLWWRLVFGVKNSHCKPLFESYQVDREPLVRNVTVASVVVGKVNDMYSEIERVAVNSGNPPADIRAQLVAKVKELHESFPPPNRAQFVSAHSVKLSQNGTHCGVIFPQFHVFHKGEFVLSDEVIFNTTANFGKNVFICWLPVGTPQKEEFVLPAGLKELAEEYWANIVVLDFASFHREHSRIPKIFTRQPKVYICLGDAMLASIQPLTTPEADLRKVLLSIFDLQT